MMRDCRNALAALIFLAVPTPAGAAAGASCSLSATPLAFGNYVPTAGSPSDFTATISLTCTASGTVPAAIHGNVTLLSPGGPSGHRLSQGAHGMRYQLYLDPARTVLWGDSGSGTAAITGVASPTSPFRQAITVYGRILARQSGAIAGTYTDQITVVLNY